MQFLIEFLMLILLSGQSNAALEAPQVQQKEVIQQVEAVKEKKYSAKTIEIELKRNEIQVMTYNGLIERDPTGPKVEEYKAEVTKYQKELDFWIAKKAEFEASQP